MATRKDPNLIEDVFADVAPLPGARRVRVAPAPPLRGELPVRSRWQTERSTESTEPLIVERDDDCVWGYRSELGRQAAEALSARHWLPAHSVDLHGRRVRAVKPALAGEIRALARRGVRRLLIIHGKGLHSERGVGVLAEAVVEALTEPAVAIWIRAFRTAPQRLGGSGAMAVEISPRPR